MTPPAPPWTPLTPEELDAMQKLAEGLENCDAKSGAELHEAIDAFEAAARPATVLRLLAQVREAEARWEALKATLPDGLEFGWVRSQIARLEREPPPAREDRTRCPRMSPPEWTEHWREWHRGHGCELDPDVKRSQP